jgi:hypothetical protein
MWSFFRFPWFTSSEGQDRTMAALPPEAQARRAELPTPDSTHSYWHREPSKKLLNHRTTKDLPATADVLVVGSGISGAFAARELVAGGRSVVMLEAREACWGATGRVSLTKSPLLLLHQTSCFS